MNQFNKALLSDLLIKAQGDRTREKYSEDAGISLTQVSKLMRQISDGPPRPATLKLLSSAAQNGISYDDLMAACGYTSQTESESPTPVMKSIFRTAKDLTEDELKEIDAIMKLKISLRKGKDGDDN